MRICILSILISVQVILGLQAQNEDNPKSMIALNIVENKIELDGILDEDVWQKVPQANGFVQTEPVPGQAATFDTDVKILYDNEAIFVGAKLYDPEPNKILKELSIRDQTGNAETFSVFFDSYKSGLNGFLFTVTSSGVQVDAIVSNHNDDNNWNAVWESMVHIGDFGWSVEMKIPYSAIRFPESENQTWHVQCGREIRRFRETSYWNRIDPTIEGWVQQSGRLEGIKNIKPPVRLSISPYVTGYLDINHDPNRVENQTSIAPAYNIGMDLKYGINDAFTLDMTLIPDFGQVISDQQVLNLSPFEVFFQENRQFFTEGIELFDKGNLFYSRRIGDRPLKYFSVYNQLEDGERIVDNPSISQLYNATKISGRTESGTGLGVFNAIVSE